MLLLVDDQDRVLLTHRPVTDPSERSIIHGRVTLDPTDKATAWAPVESLQTLADGRETDRCDPGHTRLIDPICGPPRPGVPSPHRGVARGSPHRPGNTKSPTTTPWNRSNSTTPSNGRRPVAMTAGEVTPRMREREQHDRRDAGTHHPPGHPRLRRRGRRDDPARPIHWCTGSDEEWTELTDALVATGTFTRLNPAIKPNSFYAASDPTDVARVEDRTYICSVDEKDCGPTNNWMDPDEMKDLMRGLYAGCMKGRTMYVIPFVMGHLEAEKPMFGIEITDSAYVTARCG